MTPPLPRAGCRLYCCSPILSTSQTRLFPPTNVHCCYSFLEHSPLSHQVVGFCSFFTFHWIIFHWSFLISPLFLSPLELNWLGLYSEQEVFPITPRGLNSPLPQLVSCKISPLLVVYPPNPGAWRMFYGPPQFEIFPRVSFLKAQIPSHFVVYLVFDPCSRRESKDRIFSSYLVSELLHFSCLRRPLTVSTLRFCSLSTSASSSRTARRWAF